METRHRHVKEDTLVGQASRPHDISTMPANPATTNSSGRSMFLEMPAELRNRIYGYALYHDRNKGELGAVNILSACRQIYNGAKELLFEDSTFTIAVTTPYTPWWDIENSSWAGKHSNHTRTLAITGDLEAYLHGKRKPGILVDCGTPSPEVIHDSFPAAMRKLTHINIDLEMICYRTAQYFIYALACFLNTPSVRCRAVHFNVKQPREVAVQRSEENYDELWYGLAKIPAEVVVTFSGDVTPHDPRYSLWPRGLEIHFGFLHHGHAHPEAPGGTKFNTIAALKRVDELASPMIKQTEEEFKLLYDKERGHHPDTSVLVFEMGGKLHRLKERLREGKFMNSWFNAWVDQEAMLDLQQIEEWAQTVVSGKPMWMVSEGAEFDFKYHWDEKRRVWDEVNHWRDVTVEAIWAEDERRRAAGEA